MRGFRGLAMSIIVCAVYFGCSSAPTSTGSDSPGIAAKITEFVGDSQTATANAVLFTPLTVQVVDALGNPVSGASVSWTVDNGGGVVSPATSLADRDGRASTIFTLGAKLGVQSAHASVATLPAHVTFNATVFPTHWSGQVPSRIAALAGNGQVGGVQQVLTHPLIIVLTDAQGTPVSGLPVTWRRLRGGPCRPRPL